MKKLNIVFAGLSITSSWGNGHATTYRSLIKALFQQGHKVTFLERDVPWYSENRDMAETKFCDLYLYNDISDIRDEFNEVIESADFIIVGSYVPEGVQLAELLFEKASCPVGFYDIDTPVTLAKLERGDYEYLAPHLISKYDIYLSFTGGSVLDLLEKKYGSPMARPLYCSVDTQLYNPDNQNLKYDMGYLGTYSDDRQPGLEKLLFDPAKLLTDRDFIVAGSQYPEHIKWPENIKWLKHLPPAEHRDFYNSQRYALNITRQDMVKAGYSPSVRLFEAAACETPIISDYWTGLEEFFEPETEILISIDSEDTYCYLKEIPESERIEIGEKARQRVLKEHTSEIRAKQLAEYITELI